MNETDGGGLKRRLLPPLLAEVGAVRRRRVARRRGVGAAALLMVAFGVTLAARWRVTPPQQPAPIAGVPKAGSTPTTIELVRSSGAALAAWRIETNPSALASALSRPDVAAFEHLDDQRLLDFLASIGRPTGIVRSGGRTWLTADVADPLPRQSG